MRVAHGPLSYPIDYSSYHYGKAMRFLPVILFGILSTVSIPCTVYGAQSQSSISWITLTIGLFGGLALFLYGLEQLSEGLKKAAGDALRVMLAKLTTNRIMGAVTGAVVTGILNSSSVTTVLVVGFVTAGVMNLQQSVGVIMGANIGSTVTAQILAFNISKYALLPIAVGFFMLFISKKDHIRHYGMMFMGLGMVFFGMSIMSDAMYPLRSYEPFLNLLQKMENPLLGILAGALFTGLVQSSAATVGIAIAMASGGLLSLGAGIALALGANIGTCITALMAAMGKPPEAVRAAIVHISFNLLGVLIWLPFLSQLSDFAVFLSPHSSGLSGAEKMAAEVPRQIANANTLFNIINTVIFLPFTAYFAAAANKLIKDKPTPPAIIKPFFLDDMLLTVPGLAMIGVRRELARIAELAVMMIDRFGQAFTKGDFESIQKLVSEDDKIDILEQECIQYLSRIQAQSLSTKETVEYQTLMTTAISLETLADVIETDMVELAGRSLGIDYQRSDTTKKMLSTIYINVRMAVVLLSKTITENDKQSAREIVALKPLLKDLQRDFTLRKSERLRLGTPDAIKIARIEVSAVDKMLRMYSLARRIAKSHLGEKD